MVHFLTLTNWVVQFRHEKTTPLPFLNAFAIEDALSAQWIEYSFKHKYGSMMNPRQLPDAN